MEIADLFYNPPARLKYLKSDSTELANVTTFIEKLALSHDDISFTLTNNGKRIVFTSGSGDLLNTIHEIYGYSVSSNMIEICASNDDYDIYGFICKPSILKSNRNHMTTIVNGRIVKNVEVNKAINDGYYTFKPDIKYPVVVLKIETDPTLVDVNIHPTKQDIKFSKIDELNKLIRESIASALKKVLLVPEVKVEVKIPEPLYSEISMPLVMDDEEPYTTLEQVSIDFKESDAGTYKEVLEIQESNNIENVEENELVKKLELYPVGIALGTYIIAQNQVGVFLIDQHAAQERINYEKNLAALKAEKVTTTSVLIPISIELSASEALK